MRFPKVGAGLVDVLVVLEVEDDTLVVDPDETDETVLEEEDRVFAVLTPLIVVVVKVEEAVDEGLAGVDVAVKTDELREDVANDEDCVFAVLTVLAASPVLVVATGEPDDPPAAEDGLLLTLLDMFVVAEIVADVVNEEG